MRTPSFAALYGNPFVAWTQLAWKTGELMVSSAEVIGRRAAGMALAGPAPGMRDQREMALMGREKLEAAAESGYAMWWSLARMNQQLATLALRQMLAGAAGMAALASSRTAAESVQRQAGLAADALAHSATTAARASASTARIAQRGLTPIRSRAARNAKRLRKRRR
ncbi:MAG TPA: polyhydroxyalkanoate granule-associated phasin [Burkholderiales bacterium]|nr:polyhydroxyalkanoate granule-associated phasin [Burkholderiales bacterium]